MPLPNLNLGFLKSNSDLAQLMEYSPISKYTMTSMAEPEAKKVPKWAERLLEALEEADRLAKDPKCKVRFSMDPGVIQVWVKYGHSAYHYEEFSRTVVEAAIDNLLLSSLRKLYHDTRNSHFDILKD